MPSSGKPQLIAAAATPAAAAGGCLDELYRAHVAGLLERGCDAVALFGTTGEGPAFTVAERLRALDALLDAGIAADRLVMAAMSAAPGDVLALCRHAVAGGVRRLLVMPPFFFRGAARAEGLLRFYGELIERLGDDRVRLLLYHFPEMSGAAVTPELARQLRERFGAVIDGIKDSGGDLDESLALVQALPELRILIGTEVQLPAVIAAGGAGTICGLANLAPELVGRLLGGEPAATTEGLCRRLDALDEVLSGAPFAVALKAALAVVAGRAEWALPMPPLAPLRDAAFAQLEQDLAAWHEAGSVAS